MAIWRVSSTAMVDKGVSLPLEISGLPADGIPGITIEVFTPPLLDSSRVRQLI